MQERQVTVEGETFVLDPPFHVLATANPVEYEGTYPLPEAQLDRFLLRVGFGYPSSEEEWEVLRRRLERQREEQTLAQVVSTDELLGIQAAVEAVTVDPDIGRYCVALAAATREHQHTLVGSSPRGGLALMLVARGVRRDRRARLRRTRGRQGGGRAGAGAPDHDPPRALDDRHLGPVGGGDGARTGPGADRTRSRLRSRWDAAGARPTRTSGPPSSGSRCWWWASPSAARTRS